MIINEHCIILILNLDYIELNRKYCTPKVKFAESSKSMTEVKEQCSLDSTCNMFYKSGKSRAYFKCEGKVTIKPSSSSSIVQIKGINTK